MQDSTENKDKEQNQIKNTGSDSSGTAVFSDVLKMDKAPEKIGEGVVNLIPEETAQMNQMMAFEREGRVVKVAMVNPQDINALNVLRFIAEKEKIEIEKYQVSPDLFREMFNAYSGPGEMIKEAVESFEKNSLVEEEETDENKGKKAREVLKDAPVTKLVEVIISHAIEGRASDIHIEPMDRDYRVRFRMDGILHTSLILPMEIGPVIISRIKILANLKIDEKRKPQDGRFKMINNGKEIDFRVSTFPLIDGEKVVMRILDKEGGIGNVKTLGMIGSALENVERALRETYGMILMTGPTGSGKSTTLYALLKILNGEERNIVTLEDPIEYSIEGINQSQIKPEIGYTFANGLRTILRQDPNVIMVGEIRDSETAELAVHSALTGHLMFSTLHTNTAIGAIPRLIDMGIEPFLLSSSLRMVMAQRLVRKICDKCKEEEKISENIMGKILDEVKNISEEELKKYGVDLSKKAVFYHGKGCEECGNTGLKGRLAIYEVVPVNDNVKIIINEKKGSELELRKERDAMGVLTMRQDGILKALLGMTTMEEVERVTEGKVMIDEEVN